MKNKVFYISENIVFCPLIKSGIEKKEREKRVVTTAKINAGFSGFFNGSSLSQNRQSVFDGLA